MSQNPRRCIFAWSLCAVMLSKSAHHLKRKVSQISLNQGVIGMSVDAL